MTNEAAIACPIGDVVEHPRSHHTSVSVGTWKPDQLRLGEIGVSARWTLIHADHHRRVLACALGADQFRQPARITTVVFALHVVATPNREDERTILGDEARNCVRPNRADGHLVAYAHFAWPLTGYAGLEPLGPLA